LVTERPQWIRLLATAGLLAAIVVSGRGSVGPVNDSDTLAAACEITPPQDAAGLERCLALNPRDIELMLDLGLIYERTAELDRAEVLYRRALSIDAKDGDVHVRLGRLLLHHHGDRSAAANEARTALWLQPRSQRAIDLLSRAEREARP